MAELNCWNCGADASDEPLPLSRQASCQKCGEYLHCCRGCMRYAPDKPGSCDHDLTDPPHDKTSANFCEFFKPQFGIKTESKNDHAKSQLDALFGEEHDEDEKGVGDENPQGKRSNPLDDLFDD